MCGPADMKQRTEVLGPNHIGYIDSKPLLRAAHKQFSKAFKRRPTTVDLILSQVLVMGKHIERLCKLPWEERLTQLSYMELKPASKRKGVTLATATLDDFQLDSKAWDFMSSVDWQNSLEAAYKLHCASQVVDLWGNRHSTDFAAALFFWGIQVDRGEQVPFISGWSAEIAQTFGGNEFNALARRAEMKDFLVGWSTSFTDAGLSIPLIAGPQRGKAVGTGLTGFGGDRRRPIPEHQMALAAAPVVANHWRAIAIARLQTRSDALPLDTEYSMAAKMFAQAFAEKNPVRRSASVSRRGSVALSRSPSVGAFRIPTTASPSRAPSTRYSRASSVASGSSMRASPAPSAITISAVSISAMSVTSSRSITSREEMLRTSRDEMLRRMNLAPARPPTPPPPEPSIEELLARRDDSSDDDAGGESDDDMAGNSEPRKKLDLDDAYGGAPFAFSIGPNGSFSVAADDNPPSPVVTVSRKRPSYVVAPVAKRPRKTPPVPPSPPLTTPSAGRRSPSPSPSLRSIGSAAPSATPSLQAMSMSPSPSHYSLPDQNDDVSRYAYLLRRERDQYITYNIWNERKRGLAMSKEVEAGMNEWVARAKTRGEMPAEITPRYLASLGVSGDPRRQDLGPFLMRNAHRWSSTECFLRLGIKPTEFPLHHLVHSLTDLKWKLERHAFDACAEEGEEIDATQLDAELDLLFAERGEEWRDLLCSKAEADAKEKVFLKRGFWSYDRTIPEGPVNKLDAAPRPAPGAGQAGAGPSSEREPGLLLPKTSSKRINYDALRRLMGQEVGDDGDDDEFKGVLGETLLVGVGGEEEIGLDLGGDGEVNDEDLEWA